MKNKKLLPMKPKALITDNPLIKKAFENFKDFKTRSWIPESLAPENSTEREGVLNLIKAHNKVCLKKQELYPTTLCQANPIIIELILDKYDLVSGGEPV